jgi:hypothetical protein
MIGPMIVKTISEKCNNSFDTELRGTFSPLITVINIVTRINITKDKYGIPISRKMFMFILFLIIKSTLNFKVKV